MAIPTLTLTALQTELSNLLGETGLQSNVLTPRQQFLQDALRDAWKIYPWPFSMVDTTLAFTSGVALLPADFMPDGHFYVDDGIHQWAVVEWADRNNPNALNTYYIRYNATTQLYEAVMANSSGLPSTTITLNLRYQYSVPALNDTTGIPYPNAKTLALGAMVYVTLADNQDADVSQKIEVFEKSVQEDYSAFNRIRGRNTRAQSVSERFGHSTGGYA